MSSSRPIPSKSGRSSADDSDESPPHHGFHRESLSYIASSFSRSFTEPAPIAREAIDRDVAELEDEEEDEAETDLETGDDDSQAHLDDDSPYLYRRPSNIAFGLARPAGLTITHLDEAPLSNVEKDKSRDEERSLLRDNHLIPPKHPIVGQPSLIQHLYKKAFSTKVPRPSPDEETPEGESPTLSPGAEEPTETTALLQPSEVQEHLDEQWDYAVATGQLKTTWQREAKTIAVYSRSLILTFLLQYSISITSIFAVGHIGKLELGAVSLATMTGNITFWAPIQGLTTCLDTLCAQAFGSGHKTLVGLQVQRMACFLLIVLIPLAVVWWHAAAILKNLIPEPQSAELAGLYLRVLIIGMPSFVFFECGKRFVQSQGLFVANTYVLMIAAPMNIALNYTFVWHLGWGFIGAPIAVVITQWTMPTLLLLYIIFVDGSQCWGGFSKRAFLNWGPMIRLALPGMLMVSAEYLAFEILTLASGQFGTSELAAQSILVTITSTTYQIPFPVSIAASTRVANLIGAKLPDAAKTCARVAVIGGCLVSVFNLVLVASLRYKIPILFTDDMEVINLVATAMPVCAVMQLFDGLCVVAHGLLRGVGRPEIGGYAGLITYYLFALPISFGTAFGLGWKLSGLWFGVTLGLLVVTMIEYVFLYRYDWEQAVKEAERRNAAG